MGDVTVDLDDDLEKAAAGLGVDLAAVCADAAARAVARAEARSRATADIRRVAERLIGTDTDATLRSVAYGAGLEWARETATLAELRLVVDVLSLDGLEEGDLPASLVAVFKAEDLDPVEVGDDFVEAACEVWEAVAPLIGLDGGPG